MREQLEKSLQKVNAKIATLELAHETRLAPLVREKAKYEALISTLDEHEKPPEESNDADTEER